MNSYVGPAQLLLAGHTCDVEVNLQQYLDLSDAPRARWRGVVMNASFAAAESSTVRVRIPGRGEAEAALAERRLVGDGTAPFCV